MSVPLPPIHLNACIGPLNTLDESVLSTRFVGDLFLSSDERYLIQRLKVAERPFLIYHIDESEKNIVDVDPSNIPLIDGYDISGWRQHGIMVCADLSDRLAILPLFSIGASSTMFRRDRQWPVFPKEKYIHPAYLQLSRKLRSPPLYSDSSLIKDQPLVLLYEDCCREIMISNEYQTCCTEFARLVEQRNIPAKILGATKGWLSMPSTICNHNRPSSLLFDGMNNGWTFAQLLQRFGDVFWRFSDTHGEMMTLHTYAKYIFGPEGLADDSPLAIYDSEFGDADSPTHELVYEYNTPLCFSKDLFEYADCSHSNLASRPPWRWILIGPEKSGTGLHIDPLWTNAWVTILQGRKRWILFPPNTPKKKIGMIQPQIPSVVWFLEYYDKVMNEDWPDAWKPIEFLQEAGETVFVPSGWPHLVLNLELTVAVTHNYASEFGPFERMCEQVILDEPDFARVWYQGLRNARPDLADRMINYLEQSIRNNQKWATEWRTSLNDI